MTDETKELLDGYINDALNSWHGSMTDATNPAMKFIGETGETIDYIAKLLFKPNFNLNEERREKLISELGDGWYYWRMLVKVLGVGDGFYNDFNRIMIYEPEDLMDKHICLANMSTSAANIYYMVIYDTKKEYEVSKEHEVNLIEWLIYFIELLHSLGIDFQDMHDYNVNKLSGADNHGWKGN